MQNVSLLIQMSERHLMTSRPRRISVYVVSTCVALVFLNGCLGSGYEEPEPWNVVANCSSDVTSTTAITGITNPYYNGYRLKAHSYSYGIGDRTHESPTYYSYNEPLTIKLSNGRQSTSSWISNYSQTYDNNGYLTGGSRTTAGGASIGGGHVYEFGYGDDGQMLSYDIARNRKADFLYIQGRLDTISFYNDEGEIRSTIFYEYDEQSNLVSAYDTSINVRYDYRCNELNQITDAYTTRIDSDGEEDPSSHYMIEYDDHGNLTKVTNRYASGHLGATNTYEYEQTNELVFNHWLLRLSTGFVWSAADLVD